MKTPEAVALGVGLWGAALSTTLAVRQIVRERRRLRLIATNVLYVDQDDHGGFRFLEVLQILAHNDGSRPVMAFQAGVVTQDGTHYHPRRVDLHRGRQALEPPCMLQDGETASFYFDLLSFEGSTPKAVWVQDAAMNRYQKRLSRKRQRELGELVAKLRERLGRDVDSQMDLPFEPGGTKTPE